MTDHFRHKMAQDFLIAKQISSPKCHAKIIAVDSLGAFQIVLHSVTRKVAILFKHVNM